MSQSRLHRNFILNAAAFVIVMAGRLEPEVFSACATVAAKRLTQRHCGSALVAREHSAVHVAALVPPA
jgi:hypothetical protein